jgi:ubiquitin C-terminal hydrolase
MTAQYGFNWSRLLATRGEETNSCKNSSIQLLDCLIRMGQTVILDGEEKWQCKTCEDFVLAEKQDCVWTWPKILIIHLERFVQISGVRRKYDINVDFPDVLDLRELTRGESIVYQLFGIIEHFGSLNSGHYTTHCYHSGKGKWYFFNDSSVKESTIQEVHSRNAYILFYERKEEAENAKT